MAVTAVIVRVRVAVRVVVRVCVTEAHGINVRRANGWCQAPKPTGQLTPVPPRPQ